MKHYKVEVVQVKKEYASITVEADSRLEAIEKARGAEKELFDETEMAESIEWKANSDWGFFNMFKSIFN